MATKTAKVTEARIDALTPDPHNANRGTERGAGMLERSIRENGLGRSVLVDKHGILIAGNKTVETAASIGMEDTIVVETDGTKLVVVKRTDLDLSKDAKAKALAVADNRVAESDLAWDTAAIDALVKEGIDLSYLFNESELNNLLSEGDPLNNYDEMLKGLPEYDQPEASGIKLSVHFKNEEDRQVFAQLIGIPLTGKTQAIWYPDVPNIDAQKYRVKGGA